MPMSTLLNIHRAEKWVMKQKQEHGLKILIGTPFQGESYNSLTADRQVPAGKM